MEAVESSVLLYESVSEAISLGLAGPLRRRAVARLHGHDNHWTLDLGAGPGVSTRLLLSRGFENVVGLDPSVKLLRFARSRLGAEFHPVVGVSENLPFKTGVFDSVLACFALRDVKDLSRSLREISKVTRHGGGLAIVDVGKPAGMARRQLVWLYIRFAMPLVARLLIRRRMPGNPFTMIIPTFRQLVTNGSLQELVQREYGASKLQEFMLGGLVVLNARKPILSEVEGP